MRRHHPLQGQTLDLLSPGKAKIVVRLPDGSSMKIRRHWTDLDGVACAELTGNSQLSLKGLRELLSLFLALRERTHNESVG